MTTKAPYKPAGYILMPVYEGGFIPEHDNRDKVFQTIGEFCDTLDDPHTVERLFMFHPYSTKTKRALVWDVTDEFVEWLMEHLRGDLVDHDERFGCPACMYDRAWEYEVNEERKDAAEWAKGPIHYFDIPSLR